MQLTNSNHMRQNRILYYSSCNS